MFVLVEPRKAVAFSFDRPFSLGFGEQRILCDNDARDGIDAVPAHRIEHGAQATIRHRSRGVGTDVVRERYVRVVEHETAVILHVDDEGVDLGPFSDVDQLPHAVADRRPAIDVESAHRIRRWYERRRWTPNRIGKHAVSLRHRGVLTRRTAPFRSRSTFWPRARIRAGARESESCGNDERSLKSSLRQAGSRRWYEGAMYYPLRAGGLRARYAQNQSFLTSSAASSRCPMSRERARASRVALVTSSSAEPTPAERSLRRSSLRFCSVRLALSI